MGNRKVLKRALEDSKPVSILLAVASTCLAATGTAVQLTLAEINAIKAYKKELFAAIKQLPCTNIRDKNELQNQILLAAFNKEGVAGDIFYAPTNTWAPNFLSECKTDSGTLKDITGELVARGLLRKKIENQEEETADESEIKLMNLSKISRT